MKTELEDEFYQDLCNGKLELKDSLKTRPHLIWNWIDEVMEAYAKQQAVALLNWLSDVTNDEDITTEELYNLFLTHKQEK